MGANHSGSQQMIASALQENLESWLSLHKLSYEDFLQSIYNLNEICRKFSNGSHIMFAIKRGSDVSILWKATVRIKCYKLTPDNGTYNVEAFKILTLKQFVSVYHELCYRAEITKSPANYTFSKLFEKLDTDQSIRIDTECCICLERTADTLLSCAHEYCSRCIAEWAISHSTCPQCRSEMDDDSWVIAEKPEVDEMLTEVPATFANIVERVRGGEAT